MAGRFQWIIKGTNDVLINIVGHFMFKILGQGLARTGQAIAV